MCGSSSVAERQLPKLNVAGSIPVSRSISIKNLADSQLSSLVQIWSSFLSRPRIRFSHDQIAHVDVRLTGTLAKGRGGLSVPVVGALVSLAQKSHLHLF